MEGSVPDTTYAEGRQDRELVCLPQTPASSRITKVSTNEEALKVSKTTTGAGLQGLERPVTGPSP